MSEKEYGVTEDAAEAHRANMEKAIEASRVLSEIENNNQAVRADIWHRSWEASLSRHEQSKLPEWLVGCWVTVSLVGGGSVAFEALVEGVTPLGVELLLLTRNGEKTTRESAEQHDADEMFVPWTAGPSFLLCKKDKG